MSLVPRANLKRLNDLFSRKVSDPVPPPNQCPQGANVTPVPIIVVVTFISLLLLYPRYPCFLLGQLGEQQMIFFPYFSSLELQFRMFMSQGLPRSDCRLFQCMPRQPKSPKVSWMACALRYSHSKDFHHRKSLVTETS